MTIVIIYRKTLYGEKWGGVLKLPSALFCFLSSVLTPKN